MNGCAAAALDTPSVSRYDAHKAERRIPALRPNKYLALFYANLQFTQNAGYTPFPSGPFGNEVFLHLFTQFFNCNGSLFVVLTVKFESFPHKF